MYGKTEVQCPVCGRKQMVDTEELEHYAIGCCDTSMVETGVEEYDNDYAREQNERGRRGR